MITLTQLSALTAALVNAERLVETKEAELKVAKEQERRLREEALPAALQELGVAKIDLDTGESISVKQEVYGSIPADRKIEVFDWLEANKYDGIIKTTVDVEFGRGEIARAYEIQKMLVADHGLSAIVDRSIHAQTLKAFLREQIAKAVPFPLDMFGARPVFVATVKQRKV